MQVYVKAAYENQTKFYLDCSLMLCYCSASTIPNYYPVEASKVRKAKIKI